MMAVPVPGLARQSDPTFAKIDGIDSKDSHLRVRYDKSPAK